LTWSSRLSLDAPLETNQEQITKGSGFYRIRATSLPHLVYVGQTGRSLFERVRSLSRGVYRNLDDPPWNDPHTAAPLLWSYRHENLLQYECSVAVAKLDVSTRQCQEDALLYLHRIEHGCSTLCNHGRLHPSWTRPSNRKRGIITIRRKQQIDYPSLPPAVGNDDYHSSDWLGLRWINPNNLDVRELSNPGVYRITDNLSLAYLGESKDLNARLSTHRRDNRFNGCTYSVHLMPEALPHQLKERETDLIGGYFLKKNEPPIFQYRGNH
jgi:hypothetical protein